MARWYIFLFLSAEMVAKICTDSGQWFLHPESNRTWTNYTRCNEHTSEGRVVGRRKNNNNPLECKGSQSFGSRTPDVNCP